MKMCRWTVILLGALLLTGCMGKGSVPDEQDTPLEDVEALGVRDGQAYCRITTRGGAELFGWQRVGEAEASECLYSPVKSAYTGIEIDAENQVLQCSMSFGLAGPQVFCTYIGALETALSYDAERDAFLRSRAVSVKIYEEVHHDRPK